MSRERRRNKKIIIALALILCLMGVGYAAFQTELDIKGSTEISSEWNIKIISAEVSDTGGAGESVKNTYTDLTADLEANLYNKGDYVEYKVIVENAGTFDAKLETLGITNSNNEAVKITSSGLVKGQPLYKGESATLTVRIEYNSDYEGDASGTSGETTIDLGFVQNSEGTIVPTNDHLVTYDYTTNGGESTNAENEYITEGESINLTYTASKTNYAFIGWNTDKDATEGLTSLSMKTSDITLYAIFEERIAPEITFSIGDNVTGNNDWYKGLDINAEITDNDSVKKALYCTTTENSCTPNKELELINNKGTIQLESNKDNQKVCVKATDEVGNETTECSDAYKVDSTVPEITNMTVTPDDDTMTITLESSDNESGLYKYYFSKDSGSNYIESDNPNYTFTSLDEGDYLVTAYVKDEAGNISEIQAKSTTIRYAAFCEHNDITDLGDCVIATEAGNETDIELAKSEIQSKGEPNFKATSPSIVYSEVHANSTSTVSSTYSTYYIGTGYTFNQSTGMYNITGYNGLQDPTAIDYSNGNHYICGSNLQSASTCSTVYRVTGVTSSTNSSTGQVTYTFTKYNYTQTEASYDTSNVGLYAGSDNDGTTYYYRGSVGGNYVKFADKYWRIIRVNGDGSVRMIYDGTSPHENGEASSNRQVTTKVFNSYVNDNAYVGYMYGDVNNFEQTDSGNLTFNYTGLSNTAKYYFGTDYTFDKSSRSYKLSGDLHSGTLSSDQVGYYTCFSTSSTASCQRLFYTTKYNTSTSMIVKVKGYGSTSLEGAHANVNDSTMKDYLDSWYSSNLSSVDDKISKDAIFCNNRNISSKTSGTYLNTGYGITPTIYGYERFWNWALQGKLGPTLMCDTDDSFSVNKGNQKLTYPVGLITADEVNMAGGMTGSVNSLYYLYTGTTYWTLSPSRFNGWFSALEMNVHSSGALNSNDVWGAYGVRPVINLTTDNLTVSGSGTMEDPFVVS